MTGTIPTSKAPTSASATPSTVDITSTSDTTSPLSGAVPAQLPVRPYATATTTATPPPSAGASAPAQNAKPAIDSQINGAMAQGGSQPITSNNNPGPNGTPASHADHGRKPSVVINASGASGYTPNGGPVGQNGRLAISFGSVDADPSAAFSSQNPSSLSAPQRDPRVTSPSHSPAPIPQPPASGGRPPSNLQNQSNGLNFGSVGSDNEMVCF